MVSRVGGLASGMDIDALVEKLMSAERAPLNKLQQQKTTFEWQRDSYRNVNTKLKTFDTFVFDNYRLTSSLSKKAPTVSDSSKVDVTVSSSAQGSLSIGSVSQLATSAQVTGALQNATVDRSLATATTTFGDLKDPTVTLPSSFGFTVTKSGDTPSTKTISINLDGTSKMSDLVKQINDGDAGITASFNATTGKLSFATKTDYKIDFSDPGNADAKSFFESLGIATTKDDGTGTGTMVAKDSGTFTSQTLWSQTTNPISSKTRIGDFGLTSGSFDITVPQAGGGNRTKTISYSETDTFEALMSKINSSGAGATALIGSNGALSITASGTGSGDITFDAGMDSTLKKILTNDGAGFVSGQNATFTVNNVPMESRTNSTTVSGYNITFKQTFNEAATTVPPVTISSTTDSTTLVDKVKEFVNTYNGLIADLGATIKQTKYRDYKPLSAEQKKEMSEEEVKLWEEKAKSGLLRNDSIIREGLTKMRQQFTNKVGGLGDSTIDSFAEIGITTSGRISDGGKLIIDEEKLQAAIKKNPNQVVSIFAQTGSEKAVVDGKTVDTRGIAQRLRDTLTSITKEIEKKAGKTTDTDFQYTIGKSMVNLDTRMDRLQDRLANAEKRYWRQFGAMESAVNKSNTQSGMLMQFSGQ